MQSRELLSFVCLELTASWCRGPETGSLERERYILFAFPVLFYKPLLFPSLLPSLCYAEKERQRLTHTLVFQEPVNQKHVNCGYVDDSLSHR